MVSRRRSDRWVVMRMQPLNERISSRPLRWLVGLALVPSRLLSLLSGRRR